MKTDSLTKRLKAIEAKLPTAEDMHLQEQRAFLGKLNLEELNTLEGIAERYQTHGIEPTVEEKAYLARVVEKYTVGKHDKYFAEIEHDYRP